MLRKSFLRDYWILRPIIHTPHANHKIKPAAVLDYKYSVERSHQMLSHYSFERQNCGGNFSFIDQPCGMVVRASDY
jgi:hypothetical protein